MNIWNWIVVGFLVLNLLACLHLDFNGRKARAPYGFGGAVVTLILVSLLAFVFWKAGALGPQ